MNDAAHTTSGADIHVTAIMDVDAGDEQHPDENWVACSECGKDSPADYTACAFCGGQI